MTGGDTLLSIAGAKLLIVVKRDPLAATVVRS